MVNVDIIHRWRTGEGVRLAAEILQRLVAARPLDDLKLGDYENRVDLRGLRVPEVREENLPAFRNWAVKGMHGNLVFRGVSFEDLDFSQSSLKYLQFFNSKIMNCRFDGADCGHWRLWGNAVTSSTFIRADLRAAGLGPWYEGRGNTYRFVNFSYADMRRLLSPAATYVDCDFSRAKLEKIEFQSSSFVRCRFAGKLREVIFYDHGFKTGKPDPNPMEDVDFSQATLCWVDFRRLNLDRVRLPQDENHLVVKHYRCVLERALAEIRGMEAPHARAVRAILMHRLKWIGPEQEVGVFSHSDLKEAGQEAERFATDLLRRTERECSKVV